MAKMFLKFIKKLQINILTLNTLHYWQFNLTLICSKTLLCLQENVTTHTHNILTVFFFKLGLLSDVETLFHEDSSKEPNQRH